MSTSTQELPGETTSVERRFYSRVAPHAPIYVAIDENNDCLLLNVSENGLLVSAPAALARNFVARIAVPLSGLPKPVQVNVRVVWTNETSKQSGIQLLDLSEHDREQIRKWGTRESSQFLHRQPDQTPSAPISSAKPSATPPVVAPSLTQSSSTQKAPTIKKPVDASSISSTSSLEVTTSPAARIALWGMAFAAVCLAAMFLLKNSALGNSFAHSKEILRRSSAAIPAPAQDIQISPRIPDAATSYVSANAGPPPPLASAGKSKIVPAKPSLHASSPADESANPGTNVAADEDANGADDTEDTSPTNITSPSKPAASDKRIAPPAIGANSGTSDASATRNSAVPKSSAASATSSAGGATPAVRPIPPTPYVAKDPARSPINSNEIAARIPAPLPARPGSASPTPSASRNVVAPAIQPVVQMDTPARQVMEIHLQRGSHASFFNLPGERVLESPSATIHIQRSVRMPAAHSVWPFNRTKKVTIGGLISRVDPQLGSTQIGSVDFIRVAATIDENGRVQSVKPILGRASLVPPILKAIQAWRYQPTLIDGKPVETKCDVLIQFHGPSHYSARQ
jgi:hypothetical protein